MAGKGSQRLSGAGGSRPRASKAAVAMARQVNAMSTKLAAAAANREAILQPVPGPAIAGNGAVNPAPAALLAPAIPDAGLAPPTPVIPDAGLAPPVPVIPEDF